MPSSKSYANRALVYNFIQNNKATLKNLPESEDVKNTIDAIDQIKKGDSSISLGEGGTTIRFMLCVLATYDKKFKVLVHPRFKKRPIDELFRVLIRLGAKIDLCDDEDALCYIQGPLKGNQSIDVDCSETSQFASGLALIAEKIKLKVNPTNLKNSISYFNLTQKVIDDMEAKVTTIPVDMSSSVYFILYSAIFKTMRFSQILGIDSYQADSKVFEVLDATGAKYSFSQEGLIVQKTDNLKSFDVDISNCLDLSLGLVYLALFSNGVSTMRGINNLKFKEVNRIRAIEDILISVGAKFKITNNSLQIEGKSLSSDFNLSPQPDHRVVMASSLILKTIGKEVVINRECVKKSFSNFFDILKAV